VNCPVFFALRLGEIEVKYFSTNGIEGLLDELSSSEQLLAALRPLTCLLVRTPVLALAASAAVECQGRGAVDFDVRTTCAVGGRRLTASNADFAHWNLSGHG
jgi:hypothetical protein